jgi:hypothetical protein
MSTSRQEIRCVACGRLLAKLTNGALTVQRGHVQATFDDDFHASFVCYQSRCGRLNVVCIRSRDNERRRSRCARHPCASG